MSKYRIRLYGDPILRRRAEEITEFGPELEQLARDMVEVMIDDDGIGLAAPQIGLSKRFLVIGLPAKEEDEPRRILAMANPVILEESENVVTMEEGCLSLPGLAEEVDRPDRITIKYQDLKGEEQSITTGGLLARVIQHEYDHLDGVLFIDHISPLQRSMIRGKLKDLEKESREAAREAGE
jgi:peptide deformylase